MLKTAYIIIIYVLSQAEQKFTEGSLRLFIPRSEYYTVLWNYHVHIGSHLFGPYVWKCKVKREMDVFDYIFIH